MSCFYRNTPHSEFNETPFYCQSLKSFNSKRIYILSAQNIQFTIDQIWSNYTTRNMNIYIQAEALGNPSHITHSSFCKTGSEGLKIWMDLKRNEWKHFECLQWFQRRSLNDSARILELLVKVSRYADDVLLFLRHQSTFGGKGTSDPFCIHRFIAAAFYWVILVLENRVYIV